jgi:hypothetical protein
MRIGSAYSSVSAMVQQQSASALGNKTAEIVYWGKPSSHGTAPCRGGWGLECPGHLSPGRQTTTGRSRRI